MKLWTAQETRERRPSQEAITAWLESQVTEAFANRIYRLDPAAQDPAMRDGFNRCKMLVLDTLVDFMEVCFPQPLEVPDADYGAQQLIDARRSFLNPKQETP